MQAVARAIIDQEPVASGPAVILVALEDGREQIELGERVGHAAGDLLPHLQAAPEERHGEIGDEGEGARGARQLPPPPGDIARILRCRGESAKGDVVEQRARGVGEEKGPMGIEGLLELFDPAVAIFVLQRLDLGKEIRMAAQRPLGEDDQGAGQDIGAFHRDADRHHLIGALDIVRRAVADAASAMDVERIVDTVPHAVGRHVFEQRGDDGGLLAGRHHRGGDGARGLEPVGILDQARERLLDAFHEADRQTELLADTGIGRAAPRHRLGRRGARRRQRDGAPGGKTAHQHAPTLASAFRSANDPVDGHEHVAAARRAVGEGSARGQMAAADLHALMARRDQPERDADILAFAEMVLRIKQTKGEAKQRRLGRQRDVALVPGEPDAERLPALVQAPGHDAHVAHGGGIGARERAGEREAGNLLASREPRQVMRLLGLGAVFLDQLARPERVRHHDDGDAVRALGGNLAEHERLRLGREAQAAMFLRDQHAEEAVIADELPDIVGDVVQLVADAPIVEALAELGGRAVEKGALFFRERNRQHAAELGEIGRAGEQLRVPANCAGFERLALGL